MHLFKIVILGLWLIPFLGTGQNLDKEQWQQRLITIYAPAVTQAEYQQQVEILKTHANELADFKLKVYQFLPDYYIENLGTTPKTYTNASIIKGKTKAFHVALIGLDGGVKLESNKPVAFKQITDLINTMPMRRNELEAR